MRLIDADGMVKAIMEMSFSTTSSAEINLAHRLAKSFVEGLVASTPTVALETVLSQLWVDAEGRQPESADKCVLGIANGVIGNVIFEDAYCLVIYDAESGQWFLDDIHYTDSVSVRYWMPLPDAPR